MSFLTGLENVTLACKTKGKLNTRTRTTNCDSDERFFPSGKKNYVQNNVLVTHRQAGTRGYLMHSVNRSGEQLSGSRLVYLNWEGSNDRIEVTTRSRSIREAFPRKENGDSSNFNRKKTAILRSQDEQLNA